VIDFDSLRHSEPCAWRGDCRHAFASEILIHAPSAITAEKERTALFPDYFAGPGARFVEVHLDPVDLALSMRVRHRQDENSARQHSDASRFVHHFPSPSLNPPAYHGGQQ